MSKLPMSLTQLAAPLCFSSGPFLAHSIVLHKIPSELALCQDPSVWWWVTLSGELSSSSPWTRSRPSADFGSPPFSCPPPSQFVPPISPSDILPLGKEMKALSPMAPWDGGRGKVRGDRAPYGKPKLEWGKGRV